MSRLGEQMRLVEIGHAVLRGPYIASADIKSSWMTSPMDRVKVYELSVRFARRINLPDMTAALSRGERLMAAEVAQEARNTILNEVFGEFTGPVREAMLACNNGDRVTCTRLLQAVLVALSDSQPYENPKDDLT